MSRSLWAVAAVVTAFATPAFAEDPNPFGSQPGSSRPSNWRGKERVVVDTPVEQFTPKDSAHESLISPYIYFNRCSGGCQLMGGGINDARSNISTIPAPGSYTISEYENAANLTGTAADAEWNEVMKCLREVYSPFAVTITDQRPTTGVSYTMAIVAGRPADIGLDPGILGIAPLAGDCSPQDNVISFSFANHHGDNDRVLNLCWTAAQETAHALGLDHEFQFSDGSSACNDPMTYRTDCGGQKFFRNKAASCGELEGIRPCRCGGSQNSHVKVRTVFGEGTSLIPPPTVTIGAPLGGTITNATAVAVSAGSLRGVAKVELWLNNYKWAEKPGAAFGSQGQPNPSGYSLPLPAGVPDGNIDIIVKAYDDLGLKTDSQKVTVLKGAACTSASSCAKGQKCEAGYCFWDAPTGKLGDECGYPQFCESGICADSVDGDDFCSQDCILGSTDACPMGYLCETAGGTNGLCVPEDPGGCCSVGSNGGVAALMSMLVLGLVLRRRGKR